MKESQVSPKRIKSLNDGIPRLPSLPPGCLRESQISHRIKSLNDGTPGCRSHLRLDKGIPGGERILQLTRVHDTGDHWSLWVLEGHNIVQNLLDHHSKSAA